jgi:hypothetical protein
MLLGTCLGLLSLWILWVQQISEITKIHLSILLASFYWITQMGATLFPGTALTDPEFAYPGEPPHQLIVDVVMLAILLAAYLFESKRLRLLNHKTSDR